MPIAVSTTGNASLRALAQQLLAPVKRPLLALQTQRSQLDEQLKSYRSLGSRLSELKRLTQNLSVRSSANPLRAVRVEGSDERTVAVSATAQASAGTFTLRVDALATRHSLASGEFSAEAATPESRTADSLMASEFGEPTAVRFRLKGVSTETELSIELPAGPLGRASLEAVAEGINGSSAAVSASVVQTSTGQIRLLLSTRDSGQDARVTEIVDLEGDVMARLGLAGRETENSTHPATVQAGADAKVVVNGVSVTARTNELTDLLPGVSVRLHAPSAETRSIQIERDVEAAKARMEEFIAAFNATLTEVRNQTRPSDRAGSTRGALAGDESLRQLRSELRDALAPTVGSATLSAGALGVTADREGRLTLSDPSLLASALLQSASSVENFFAADGSAGKRLSDTLDRYARSGGLLTSRQETLNGRIRSIEQRIKTQTKSFARQEETLLGRLAQLESTISSLNSQRDYLGGLLTSNDAIFG